MSIKFTKAYRQDFFSRLSLNSIRFNKQAIDWINSHEFTPKYPDNATSWDLCYVWGFDDSGEPNHVKMDTGWLHEGVFHDSIKIAFGPSIACEIRVKGGVYPYKVAGYSSPFYKLYLPRIEVRGDGFNYGVDFCSGDIWAEQSVVFPHYTSLAVNPGKWYYEYISFGMGGANTTLDETSTIPVVWFNAWKQRLAQSLLYNRHASRWNLIDTEFPVGGVFGSTCSIDDGRIKFYLPEPRAALTQIRSRLNYGSRLQASGIAASSGSQDALMMMDLAGAKRAGKNEHRRVLAPELLQSFAGSTRYADPSDLIEWWGVWNEYNLWYKEQKRLIKGDAWENFTKTRNELILDLC